MKKENSLVKVENLPVIRKNNDVLLFVTVLTGIGLLCYIIFIFLTNKEKGSDSKIQISNNIKSRLNIFLTEEEKEKLEQYFNTFEEYLKGSFLRKYLLSFMSIELKDEESLKNQFKDLNIEEIKFPLDSSLVIDKTDSLNSFLQKKIEKSGDKIQKDEYEALLNQIKVGIAKKAHNEVLNEIKKCIKDKNEEIKWEDLYNSLPSSFIV